MAYIHRIGRTGRGGKPGKAITLYTDDDKPYVRGIANLIHKSGEHVPDWMLKLPHCDNKQWKKLEKAPIRRQRITTQPKQHMPKKFLKQMEKNMKRNGFGQKGDKQAEGEEDGWNVVQEGEGFEGDDGWNVTGADEGF